MDVLTFMIFFFFFTFMILYEGLDFEMDLQLSISREEKNNVGKLAELKIHEILDIAEESNLEISK